MPKLDLDDPSLPRRLGSDYPPPFDAKPAGRRVVRLGAGLADFGVSLVTVPPGGWSSQRHWHADVDEFVWVVSGELVLVEEGTRVLLRAGQCARFPKGVPNGHHFVNESSAEARILAIGANGGDCYYPDIDLFAPAGEAAYAHTDGTPY